MRFSSCFAISFSVFCPISPTLINQVSFPTLEILDKENPKETGHYWLMVLNIRDKRFEVLDSARTFKDKALVENANKIMKGIKINWERHYNNSSVQIADWELHEIKCPKQDNRQGHPYPIFYFLFSEFFYFSFYHFFFLSEPNTNRPPNQNSPRSAA